MSVTTNELPKDSFIRNYQVTQKSLEDVSEQKKQIEQASAGKLSSFNYNDHDGYEHTLLVHKNQQGKILTLAEIANGNLSHPNLYKVVGVDVTKKAANGKQSSLYYAAIASKLTAQTFVLDGQEVEIPIYGLLFLVHESTSGEYLQGRIALTLWQEHMATTATGDYGLLRTLGQASMQALHNPNHPITAIKEIFGEEVFLQAVQSGAYDLAPHTQMDPDKLGNQYNITPIGITVTSEQVKKIETKNPAIRFFTPEEIDVLITAHLLNAHTIVAIKEHEARQKASNKK